MKYILLVVAVCFFSVKSFSAVGCLYNTQILTNDPSFFPYWWTSGVSTSCPANATTSTDYAKFQSNVTPSSSCIATAGFSTGILVNYDIAKCPIDDWIWLLIIPVSIAGTCMTRGNTIIRTRFLSN